MVIDSTLATFIDSSGIAFVLQLHLAASEARIPVTLLDPHRVLRDVLDMVGLSGELPASLCRLSDATPSPVSGCVGGLVYVRRMRLLHTSDWHLGRTLHGVDLLDHQAAYLEHLVDVVRAEQVDAVVVAGDVYDRAIPPVEAVTLLSETLARLAEHTTVVVTSGNHDSATRLGFGSALMRDRVRLRTRVAGLAEPVVLPDDDGDVLVYGIPYLDPDFARVELADGPEPLARSHEAVASAAMRRIRADLARASGSARPRSVVAAHAFVIGGAPTESERDIRVGGVDQVPAGVFAGADYVALGHLHGPQTVVGRRRDRPALQRLTARVLVLRAAPRQVDRAGGPVRRLRCARRWSPRRCRAGWRT